MTAHRTSSTRARGALAVLTLTIAIGALTGCGDSPQSTTTTTRSVTTDTTPAPAAPMQQTTTVERQTTTPQ